MATWPFDTNRFVVTGACVRTCWLIPAGLGCILTVAKLVQARRLMRLVHKVGGLARQLRERLIGQRIHTCTQALEEAGLGERLGKCLGEMCNESVRDSLEGVLCVRLLDEPEKVGARKATGSRVAMDVIAPGTERLRGAQELGLEIERHAAAARATRMPDATVSLQRTYATRLARCHVTLAALALARADVAARLLAASSRDVDERAEQAECDKEPQPLRD